MSTQIAIAFSQATDPQEAAYEACTAAKNQLNTAQTDLVIIFASASYIKNEVLEIIHSLLRPQRLIGSSAAGIILSENVFNRGIAVLAVNSGEMDMGIAGSRPAMVNDPRVAGFEWARKINADFKTHQHRACLMFADYGLQDCTQFIRGAQEVLGFGFPIVGAISSDDFTFKKTAQFYQKQMLNQGVTGLLLGGVSAAAGNKHGFKPLGKPRTITKAIQNVIHTIDDKPAMHIYEEYLGPEAVNLGKGLFAPHTVLYPLGIYLEAQGQYLLKNAVDILVDGSIVCQGEVPQGGEVHLMIGNKDTCRQSAIDAATVVKAALDGRQPRLIIIIESAARHRILKNSASAEVQAIKEVLGYTTPLIGMCAFGEIVPFSSGGANNIFTQNESITILAID